MSSNYYNMNPPSAPGMFDVFSGGFDAALGGSAHPFSPGTTTVDAANNTAGESTGARRGIDAGKPPLKSPENVTFQQMLFTLLQEFVSANSARAAYDDQKHAVLVTHLNEVLESSKTEQKRMNELEIVLKRFTEGFETHLKTLGDMAAETKGDVGCISKKLDAMHYYKQVKNSVRPPARPAAAQQNTNPLRTTRPPVSWSQFQDQYASLQANMQSPGWPDSMQKGSKNDNEIV